MAFAWECDPSPAEPSSRPAGERGGTESRFDGEPFRKRSRTTADAAQQGGLRAGISRGPTMGEPSLRGLRFGHNGGPVARGLRRQQEGRRRGFKKPREAAGEGGLPEKGTRRGAVGRRSARCKKGHPRGELHGGRGAVPPGGGTLV